MFSFHGRKERDLTRQAMAAADAHRAMTNSLPDEELMLQVREGVGEMLGVLFDRYQLPLFNFYCRLTGDRAASEDLVQDVFFRILKYRQSYKPGTPFRAWIYQIARNARQDYHRKHPSAVPFDPEMSPAVVSIDVAENEQQAALLRRALLMLPEDKRDVLLLSRFQELKYEEISRLLDCEVNTVKVRVHRALRELRTIFDKISNPNSSKAPFVAEGEKGTLS